MVLTTKGPSSLTLLEIVEAFKSPINEEQAWALCYQIVKNAISRHDHEDETQPPSPSSSQDPRPHFPFITSMQDLILSRDGSVKLGLPSSTDPKQNTSSKKFLSSLGVVLFQALDFGLKEDEERTLENNLEKLIEDLTSADKDIDSGDEGIERDSDESSECGISLNTVLETCVNHVATQTDADVHYRAVTRAQVVEAEELLAFLTQIKRGAKQLQSKSWSSDNKSTSIESSPRADLSVLESGDWCQLWMQVIRQLRSGVQLKKVEWDLYHRRAEYALTPYEMLMNDIKSKYKNLRHVDQENVALLRRVKKDAHELILEFIRSRPPLVPLSKRRIPPTPPKHQSLHDKLMQSLRQKHQLKPTPLTRESTAVVGRVVSSETVESTLTRLGYRDDNTPTARKRLIKADLSFSTLGDEEDLKFIDETEVCQEDTPVASPSPTDTTPTREPQPAVQSNNFTRNSKSRFSLRNITRFLPSLDMSSTKINERKISAPDISHQVVKPSTSRRNSKNNDELIVNPSEDPRDQVTDSTDWTRTEECLSLTLDEVQHIRTELTKAELESLGVTRSLKDDLEKGKICFTCLKTRFSYFGPSKVICKLCKRTICEKCSTSMHVPSDLGLVSGSEDGSTSPSTPTSSESKAPLMKLCRDCKVLVEKLVEASHNSYNNSALTRGPSIRRPTFIVSSV